MVGTILGVRSIHSKKKNLDFRIFTISVSMEDAKQCGVGQIAFDVFDDGRYESLPFEEFVGLKCTVVGNFGRFNIGYIPDIDNNN